MQPLPPGWDAVGGTGREGHSGRSVSRGSAAVPGAAPVAPPAGRSGEGRADKAGLSAGRAGERKRGGCCRRGAEQVRREPGVCHAGTGSGSVSPGRGTGRERLREPRRGTGRERSLHPRAARGGGRGWPAL